MEYKRYDVSELLFKLSGMMYTGICLFDKILHEIIV